MFAEILEQHPVFCIILAAIMALITGSFINLLVWRLPRMLEARTRAECEVLLGLPETSRKTLNLFTPRSFCPHCSTTIPAYWNIPLLGFLLLWGRCHACKTPISWRYPLLELVTVGLVLAAFCIFGFSLKGLFAAGFLVILLALTVIDIEHQLLPDCLTLFLLWAGLIANLDGLFVPLQTAVCSAAGGYLALWSIAGLYQFFRHREGLGGGDIKLFAALGAWFGWMQLQLILMLAAFAGAVFGALWLKVSKKPGGTPIPFGPFLAAAGSISLFWGDALLRMYWQLFN